MSILPAYFNWVEPHGRFGGYWEPKVACDFCLQWHTHGHTELLEPGTLFHKGDHCTGLPDQGHKKRENQVTGQDSPYAKLGGYVARVMPERFDKRWIRKCTSANPKAITKEFPWPDMLEVSTLILVEAEEWSVDGVAESIAWRPKVWPPTITR
jgi:hypothetical protein